MYPVTTALSSTIISSNKGSDVRRVLHPLFDTTEVLEGCSRTPLQRRLYLQRIRYPELSCGTISWYVFYPFRLKIDYIAAVFGTRHYTITSAQGFKVVVNGLTSSIPKSHIHTSTPITSISGSPSKYTLHSTDSTIGPFKHVIFAAPAHISSKLLTTLRSHDPEISANLNIFKYVPSLVVTHTDPTFIPSSPSFHRDLHFQRPSTPISSLQKLTNYTHATHILHHRSPHLQSLQVYQTTNPNRYPQKGSILSQTWFERYLPSLESLKTRKETFGRNGWAQGTDNMWFVGSYLGEGIPLLEGCVESAEMVVEMLLEREDGKARWTSSWCA